MGCEEPVQGVDGLYPNRSVAAIYHSDVFEGYNLTANATHWKVENKEPSEC